MEDKVIVKKKRGRPPGYKLSKESRTKISNTMTGNTKSLETRSKISSSLLIYFRTLHPVSEEMIAEYASYNDNVCQFLLTVSGIIDADENIRTERYLDNRCNFEVTTEYIELFGHDLTPEYILELKEELKKIYKTKKENNNDNKKSSRKNRKAEER